MAGDVKNPLVSSEEANQTWKEESLPDRILMTEPNALFYNYLQKLYYLLDSLPLLYGMLPANEAQRIITDTLSLDFFTEVNSLLVDGEVGDSAVAMMKAGFGAFSSHLSGALKSSSLGESVKLDTLAALQVSAQIARERAEEATDRGNILPDFIATPRKPKALSDLQENIKGFFDRKGKQKLLTRKKIDGVISSYDVTVEGIGEASERTVNVVQGSTIPGPDYLPDDMVQEYLKISYTFLQFLKNEGVAFDAKVRASRTAADEEQKIECMSPQLFSAEKMRQFVSKTPDLPVWFSTYLTTAEQLYWLSVVIAPSASQAKEDIERRVRYLASYLGPNYRRSIGRKNGLIDGLAITSGEEQRLLVPEGWRVEGKTLEMGLNAYATRAAVPVPDPVLKGATEGEVIDYVARNIAQDLKKRIEAYIRRQVNIHGVDFVREHMNDIIVLAGLHVTSLLSPVGIDDIWRVTKTYLLFGQNHKDDNTKMVELIRAAVQKINTDIKFKLETVNLNLYGETVSIPFERVWASFSNHGVNDFRGSTLRGYVLNFQHDNDSSGEFSLAYRMAKEAKVWSESYSDSDTKERFNALSQALYALLHRVDTDRYTLEELENIADKITACQNSIASPADDKGKECRAYLYRLEAYYQHLRTIHSSVRQDPDLASTWLPSRFNFCIKGSNLELMSAAYEQLSLPPELRITNCKSANDRVGFLRMAMTALEIYHIAYRCYPSHFCQSQPGEASSRALGENVAQARKRFNSIFVQVVCAQHEFSTRALAAQSDGIKKLEDILPPDVLVALNEYWDKKAREVNAKSSSLTKVRPSKKSRVCCRPPAVENVKEDGGSASSIVGSSSTYAEEKTHGPSSAISLIEVANQWDSYDFECFTLGAGTNNGPRSSIALARVTVERFAFQDGVATKALQCISTLFHVPVGVLKVFFIHPFKHVVKAYGGFICGMTPVEGGVLVAMVRTYPKETSLLPVTYDECKKAFILFSVGFVGGWLTRSGVDGHFMVSTTEAFKDRAGVSAIVGSVLVAAYMLSQVHEISRRFLKVQYALSAEITWRGLSQTTQGTVIDQLKSVLGFPAAVTDGMEKPGSDCADIPSQIKDAVRIVFNFLLHLATVVGIVLGVDNGPAAFLDALGAKETTTDHTLDQLNKTALFFSCLFLLYASHHASYYYEKTDHAMGFAALCFDRSQESTAPRSNLYEIV